MLQHTPLAVIAKPPSPVILTLICAVVEVISDVVIIPNEGTVIEMPTTSP